MSTTPPPTRRRRSRIALGSVIATLLLATLLAPASYAADGSGSSSGSSSGRASWGTRPTDNAVGTGRPRFSYTADPGGRLRDSIDVVNNSGRPLELNVYARDAFSTESGGIDLQTAKEKPADLGAWVVLKRRSVTVPAHATRAVPFTLTVPANANPGDHTGGIVTSLVTTSSSGVSVDRRIGTRIYVRVAGTLNPSLSVSDIRFEHHGTLAPWSAGSATVRYTVTNDGNTRLEAKQQVRVAGPLGILAATARPDDLPELLPGSSRTLRASVDGSWPAVRVTARVRLDPVASAEDQAGPQPSAATTAGEKSRWALPLGQVAALALLLTIIVLALHRRARRKAAVSAAIDEAVVKALAESSSR